MKVTALHIYPIKSLGGISIEQGEVLEEGFEYDRRWMLVDKDGRFLTQREHPEMALFSCSLSSESLDISFADEKQRISLDGYNNEEKRVSVWSSKLKAHAVDNRISEWFSDHLGAEVTLVKMTDISKRPKRLDTAPFKTSVSFADGYPYLILGKASMRELNNKLEKQLPIDRFRANIIVDTSVAHEEDEWKQPFVVGSAEMKVIKPCARCVVPTIDQQTASRGKEPLKTLAGYRQWNNKIWFGANAICLRKGTIKVGDRIVLG